MRRLALCATWPVVTLACSYVEVQAPGGAWVIGRTMEDGSSGGGWRAASPPPAAFTNDFNAVLHPRGQDADRRNRFAYLSFETAVPSPFQVSDGMNEAGLTVSQHTMRTAEYQDHSAPETKMEVSIMNVTQWMVGSFDTVAAVVKKLPSVRVTSGVVPSDAFVHWAIADAQGNSVVLEYVGGQPVVHNNTVRVMTNDPDFHWHLRNLNMYVGLTPDIPSANTPFQVGTEAGAVPQIWSQGFNLLGLPGDMSPASRFVRLFYLRAYATYRDPITSVDDAIVLTTGLLNNVFIPRGTVATMTPASSAPAYDATLYGLIKIPSQRRVLFRGYRNMVWQSIDLTKVQWEGGRRSMPVWDGTLGIQDVTSNFEQDAPAIQV